MVDKNKYTYWMDKNNSNYESEVVFREMYSRIGYIFHVIQMAEYNIANVLAIEEFEKEKKIIFDVSDIERIRNRINEKYEHLSTATFGQLKSLVKTSGYLKTIDFDKLSAIVDYRNYLAHICFKEKLLDGTLDNLKDVDGFVDELNDFELKVVELNEQVLQVFKNNKVKNLLLKIQ